MQLKNNIMKRLNLKDAVFTVSVICGVVASWKKIEIPFWVFLSLAIVYGLLWYTDKEIIIKK